MYGQSPYGSTMGRGMFMDPQMIMMLRMRDQMRAQYGPMPTAGDMQSQAEAGAGRMAQQSAAAGDDSEITAITEPQGPTNNRERLEQLQGDLDELSQGTQMIAANQGQLSRHLGAGAQMMGGGLGSLLGSSGMMGGGLGRLQTLGPGSLQTIFTANPFSLQASEETTEDA